MDAWLASTWTAVWPNLLADAFWIPLAWLAHRAWAAGQRVEREMHAEYVERLHAEHKRQITALHEEHRQHIRTLLNSKEVTS